MDTPHKRTLPESQRPKTILTILDIMKKKKKKKSRSQINNTVLTSTSNTTKRSTPYKAWKHYEDGSGRGTSKSQKTKTNSDTNTENEVYEALQQSPHLLQPANTIDLTTLDSTNIFNTPITPREVAEILQHTKNKTPEPSKVNTTILQHLPPNMIHRLCHIFNASLATGFFPSHLKNATLTLISKPNKSIHHVTNYRPISLLEVPGKVLGRIITNRLNTHLETNNIRNPRQYGFRAHRGTESAIARA